MTIMNSEPSNSSGNPGGSAVPEYDRSRFDQASGKDLNKILDWAKKNFEAMKQARAMTERQWKLNMAFYFGRQNVVFRQAANYVPGQSGNLYVPPAPVWRARPVINRIRPIVRKELSRLLAQKPTAMIDPNSNEDLDMYAARAGEQIWESIWRGKKLKAVQRHTLFWTLTCGTGFLKTYWDPYGVDAASQQMGDFCFVPETPFNVFCPDLRQEEIEEQPYLIHAQIRPRDEMQLKYPDFKFSNSASQREQILEDSYLNIIGAQNTTDKDTVLFLECWIKPGSTAMFPHGAMFTVVGDNLVQGGEGWPYQHGKYPFAKFDNIPSGKFYSDAVITDLIPIQREYNRTRGQIIEAKNRMAKPQLIAPAGSVDPRKITTEPGIVIEYTPGFEPPQPLPLSGLPGYVLQELDRLILDFSDISGQHEVSQGAVPPGVTAATAISYLQEQDESMMATVFDSMEEGIEKTAFMTLSLVSQYWDTQRMVKVVGVDGSFEVLAFKGSDLRDNNDIRVEAGSALPTSRAAKQAFIMDLMKMQFIPPDKGLEVMEIGGINRIYDEIQVDVREAQRENLKMAQITQEQMAQFLQIQMMRMQNDPTQVGMSPNGPQQSPGGQVNQPPVGPDGQPQMPLIIPVNNWNNDRVHIEIHNKYRKSQAFDQAAPEVKKLFDDHVKAHVDQIVMGQLAQVPPEVTQQMQANGVDPFTQGALQEAQQNQMMAAQPPGAQQGGVTDGSAQQSAQSGP